MFRIQKNCDSILCSLQRLEENRSQSALALAGANEAISGLNTQLVALDNAYEVTKTDLREAETAYADLLAQHSKLMRYFQKFSKIELIFILFRQHQRRSQQSK